jgi:shikimate dehydrogenase
VRLALLGDPVDHSRSPAIHAAALAAAGIDGVYEARRVDGDGVAAACREMRSGSLDGANVTMPWKSRAADECDQPIGEASRIGVVNTLVPVGGRVHGHNTDVAGIRDALVRLPPDSRSSSSVRVRPPPPRCWHVRAETHRRGASHRSVGSARASGRGGGKPRPLGGTVARQRDRQHHPDRDERRGTSPRLGGAGAGLVDLAYGADETPAVAGARAAGLPVVDGIGVLVAQAAASFELWTGVAAPLEAMERAARA